MFHYQLLTKRILDNTSLAVLAHGPSMSGKTTFLNMYRHQSGMGSATLHLTFNGRIPRETFRRRIHSVIQEHDLDRMGPRIGYQETMIMIDDINLNRQENFENIQMVKFLIKNKVIYSPGKAKTFEIDRVKFILSASSDAGLGSGMFALPFTCEKEELKDIFSKVGYHALGASSHTIPMRKMVDLTFELHQGLES